MTHSITIKDVKTAYSQADNSHFIDVEAEVFLGEESLGTRRFGFPLGTTEDEIVDSLKKVKDTLDSDKKTHEESAKLSEGLAEANIISENLTNTQI